MINSADGSIRVAGLDGQPACLSLPGVLAALAGDAVEGFPALRPFQRHAWHAFLVQVATLALLSAGRFDVPEDEASWAALLRGLTPDYPGDEPWCLVAPPDRPALLQPPVAALAELKTTLTAPDALDVLIAAKNHDVKSGVMSRAEPDDWLFALVSLQTMQGYSGASLYGASRMNGGFANRPGIGIAPGGSAATDATPGRHFKRDVLRLLAYRAEACRDGYAASGGLGLVWLRPWDGVASLRQAELDPYYVEICRRVRLVEVDGRLQARTGNSKAPRITPVGGGVTGDPWAPVVADKDQVKVFTADGGGFGYRRMVDLMFSDGRIRPAPLQAVADDTDAASGLAVLARALVRGQGVTEGYHERRVPLSRRVGRLMRTVDAEPIAAAAKARVQIAGEMQSRVLKAALLKLFENGPEETDFRDDGANRRAQAFLARFDREVDRTFFPDLWKEFEDGTDWEVERRTWVRGLHHLARDLVAAADRGASKAVKRRYRARAGADAVLYGAPRRSPTLQPFFVGAP